PPPPPPPPPPANAYGAFRQDNKVDHHPFLRYLQPSVIHSVSSRTKNSDPLSVFTALREWKNEF
ncbi:hypothetical protein K6U62_15365, partial [Vibrio vulnificus]